MGIMAPIVRLLLREHLRRNFTGRGLLIGRQTIPISPDEAIAIIKEEGISLRANVNAIDKSTRSARDRGYIDDGAFFSLFSDMDVTSLDVTDYEGAEIVHNMHEPIPNELENSFDFIWNGSCLDNMFDPSTAMQNTARMLKPNGRVFCMEMTSPHFDAYTMYSNAWFFDYFAVNGFAECQVLNIFFSPDDLWSGPYHVFTADSFEARSRLIPTLGMEKYAMLTFATAQKGSGSSFDKKPIQWQYRPDHGDYLKSDENFKRDSGYSLSQSSDFNPFPKIPGFTYRGSIGGVRQHRLGWRWLASEFFSDIRKDFTKFARVALRETGLRR